MAALHEALIRIVDESAVRGTYYQAEACGIVDKIEHSYAGEQRAQLSCARPSASIGARSRITRDGQSNINGCTQSLIEAANTASSPYGTFNADIHISVATAVW